MAAMLGYSIVRQSDKVSLVTFDSQVRGFVGPSNSMAQVVRMTEHLDELEAVEKTAMADCLSDVAGRLGRREIVMLFSDFFTDLDQLEPVLQRLRYDKHEVVLIQIMHHDELAFELDGMVKFVGLESPDEYLAQTEDLRNAYLAAVKRHNAQLEEIAQRNGCERLLVDTSRPQGEVFIDYFSQRHARRAR
jgi:uncharacterized protein (DUF58 family)